MDDTLIAVIDSTIGTAGAIVDKAPVETSDPALWIGWGAFILLALWNLYGYIKKMRKK